MRNDTDAITDNHTDAEELHHAVLAQDLTATELCLKSQKRKSLARQSNWKPVKPYLAPMSAGTDPKREMTDPLDTADQPDVPRRKAGAGHSEGTRPQIATYPQWGVRLSGLVVLCIAGIFAYSLATNRKLQWDIVFQYILHPTILGGVMGTLMLTVASLVITIVVGFVIAYMAQSNVVAREVARFYIWFFRGVPLLVQLLFWFNIALLIPTVTLGIPFTSMQESFNTNVIVGATTAALLGLGLHEAAYMAELVRSGIISVPRGQMEAALTLGMVRSEALRKIIFPQMLRVIIPPTGNLAIALLKASSLVAAIGGGELLSRAQFIYGQNLAVVPLLLVASAWYLLLVSIGTAGQHFLERALKPGSGTRATAGGGI